MASSPSHFLLLLFFLFSIYFTSPVISQKPIKALVLPVTKDESTLQYVTRVHQRTPSIPLDLAVHLGGLYLWVDCEDPTYFSSSYRPVRCRTAQCSAVKSGACGGCSAAPRPGCNNDTCGVFPGNPFVKLSTSGEVAEDALSVPSTDGSNPGRSVTASRFIFACAPALLLPGLANGVKGILGLGRTQIAPPTQLAATFSFNRKFALCLSSSSRAKGAIFFGNGPYRFLPSNMDLSESLIYTPLLPNPVSTAESFSAGDPSYEYFIGVKSIKVGDKSVSLNTTLLKINSAGVGGTKISTVNPYTILETSIYNSIATAFVRESGLRRVEPVGQFKHCFDARNVGATRVGPAVPAIDLVLQSNRVFWRIFGANSMVEAKAGVLCLGFVDGGKELTTSIVVGGYQLEDNLLQFDLAASRLGFSSSLLFRQITCANFNFTNTNA